MRTLLRKSASGFIKKHVSRYLLFYLLGESNENRGNSVMKICNQTEIRNRHSAITLLERYCFRPARTFKHGKSGYEKETCGRQAGR